MTAGHWMRRLTTGERVRVQHDALTLGGNRNRTVGRCASQEDKRIGTAAAAKASG